MFVATREKALINPHEQKGLTPAELMVRFVVAKQQVD